MHVLWSEIKTVHVRKIFNEVLHISGFFACFQCMLRRGSQDGILLPSTIDDLRPIVRSSLFKYTRRSKKPTIIFTHF